MLFLYTLLILFNRLKGNPLIWETPKTLKNIIPALVSNLKMNWLRVEFSRFMNKNFRKIKSLWGTTNCHSSRMRLQQWCIQHGMKFWKNIFHDPNIFRVLEKLTFSFEFAENKMNVKKLSVWQSFEWIKTIRKMFESEGSCIWRSTLTCCHRLF